MQRFRQLREFLKRHPLAVQASHGEDGFPQSAVVGVAVSENLEVFFDTLSSTRKCQNLRRDPRASLVFGWDVEEGVTVQIQGLADEPQGEELEALKSIYFRVFSDGPARQSWKGITYFRVRPNWIRLSDFGVDPPQVWEFGPDQLASLR